MFEIIVSVDGAGTPDFAGAELHPQCTRLVLVRLGTPQGVSVARNRAVERASGEILGFLDDDTVPEPDWLNRLAAYLSDQSAAVAGRIIEKHDHTTLGQLRELAFRQRHVHNLTADRHRTWRRGRGERRKLRLPYCGLPRARRVRSVLPEVPGPRPRPARGTGGPPNQLCPGSRGHPRNHLHGERIPPRPLPSRPRRQSHATPERQHLGRPPPNENNVRRRTPHSHSKTRAKTGIRSARLPSRPPRRLDHRPSIRCRRQEQQTAPGRPDRTRDPPPHPPLTARRPGDQTAQAGSAGSGGKIRACRSGCLDHSRFVRTMAWSPTYREPGCVGC